MSSSSFSSLTDVEEGEEVGDDSEPELELELLELELELELLADLFWL